MFTSRKPFPFVHQVHPGKNTITKSRCPACSVLVAVGTEAKYLAIAEAVHKFRVISAPHLTHKDFSRLY